MATNADQWKWRQIRISAVSHLVITTHHNCPFFLQPCWQLWDTVQALYLLVTLTCSDVFEKLFIVSSSETNRNLPGWLAWRLQWKTPEPWLPSWLCLRHSWRFSATRRPGRPLSNRNKQKQTNNENKTDVCDRSNENDKSFPNSRFTSVWRSVRSGKEVVVGSSSMTRSLPVGRGRREEGAGG